LVVVTLKGLLGLFQYKRLLSKEPPFGKWDVALLVYDLGQLIVWWYCTISGFSVPLHANWVNPIQWLTPYSYGFFILADIKARRSTFKWLVIRRLAAVACMAFAGASCITALTYISQRFTADLSAGSYIPLDPFPQLPASTTSTCRDLLHNPASLLYSDPSWLSGRLTQIYVIGATALVLVVWLPVLLLSRRYPKINVKRINGLIACVWGTIVQLSALIWLSIVATQGVPLMLHEGCGVVIIAMSPTRGYYDSELHYEGLKLQAAREAFGICKSLFVQTEHLSQANCTSQRRL
jgi:hypothetical protein